MEEIKKYTALGRRKEANARVRLSLGEGNITVNRQVYTRYFSRETDRIIVLQPLQLTNTVQKYNISANLKGGGLNGQAGALRLGIARALILVEPELKETLRKGGFLTRDPRAKERKKYGQKGARRRFQWTKR